jgi:hypothetical protein
LRFAKRSSIKAAHGADLRTHGFCPSVPLK